MNAELVDRWQRGLRPFEGPVLAAGEGLTEASLLVIVQRAIETLHSQYGEPELFANEDWYDHDGYSTSERRVAWGDVSSWFQSVERFRASCSSEWRVCTLLFPIDKTFCVRYWLDGTGGCSFDLCAERAVLDKIVSSLPHVGVAWNLEPSAKQYVDRMWGG